MRDVFFASNSSTFSEVDVAGLLTPGTKEHQRNIHSEDKDINMFLTINVSTALEDKDNGLVFCFYGFDLQNHSFSTDFQTNKIGQPFYFDSLESQKRMIQLMLGSMSTEECGFLARCTGLLAASFQSVAFHHLFIPVWF